MASSSSSSWSLEAYCALEQTRVALQQETIVSRLSSSSQQFLQHLNLSLLHPFCQHHDNDDSHVITVPARNVPPMGPLQSMDFSFWDHGINAWYHTAPPLLALSELWLRLFASLIAPLCVAHLLWTILHSLQTTKTKDSSKTTKATNDKNIHQGHHHTKNGTSTSHSSSNGKSDNSNGHDSNNSMAIPTSTETSSSSSPWTLVFICILGVAASVVLLTDTLYVLEFGPYVGATYLVMTTCLAVRMVVIKSSTTTTTTWSKTQRSGVLWSIVLLWCLTIRLLTKHHYDHSLQPGDAAAAAARLPWFSFGNAHDAVFIEEGLYYDNSKATASQMARQFQTTSTTNWKYAPLATKWMPTGDARTGLPFLLHQGIPSPTFLRVWLPVPSDAPSPMDQENNNQTTTPHDDDDDWEYVALDIAFPVDTTSGFDPSQPVYLILHGLNGGSQEEFVKDFTNRRTGRVYPNDHSHEHNMIPEHATVVVMVARGLMDVPIRGWNVFHGARTSDAHEAALALQRTLQQISSSSSTSSTTSTKNTMLAGVGYSMGAIILSNYVARYGKDCPLQAAVAISGGLDMRQVITFYRAQRLWQPMITTTLRHNFVVDKWGERVRARLTRDQLIHMLRSTHITEIDETAVVAYNGFDNLIHYYSEMSLLGDISLDDYYNETLLSTKSVGKGARVHNVSIPLLVIHALDDPLITWRTVAANRGFLHPSSLTQTGTGNLFLLLTKAGGHVGWPLGWMPQAHGWKWMNNVAKDFVEAVAVVKARN